MSAGPWAPLRRPLFRALWLAGLASNLGTWVQNVGAAWQMTSLAPEPFLVALVQAASNLPFFLLAIPAGALADVVDRRRLALFALAWLTAAAALLAALSFAGLVGPAALLALTFAIGIGSALLSPAFAAIIPELVPREEIEPAVSLGGISMIATPGGPFYDPEADNALFEALEKTVAQNGQRQLIRSIRCPASSRLPTGSCSS